MEERNQDFRDIKTELVKVLSWHSALNFDSHISEKELFMSASRLTNEYDSDLDVQIVKQVLEHYEENIESIDLNDYDFNIEILSTELQIFIKVTY